MAEEKKNALQMALDKNQEDPYQIPDEDFFATTLDDLDAFDEKAHNKGVGYTAPNFPLFTKYMEGLESGFYMFAGESNGGKTAILLNIMRDFALHAPNKLFGIYFSLDDSCDEVYPRLIAMDQLIPISVGSKPQRCQEIIDDDPNTEEAMIARTMLEKRAVGLQHLRETNEHFKVVDKSKVKYGEQILNYSIKLQSWLKAKDPENNIIVGIDSLSDMRFPSQRFESDKTRNDYIARTVKEWAVNILDCPIFGSLHLKKLGGNRRPIVDDVKESGEYVYEASTLFLVHNDVNKNKEDATIFDRIDGNEFKQPVIELNWAKNKKSSYKGITYHHFTTDYSKVTECSAEQNDRFRTLAQSF